jgi:hypothetical protein
MTRVAGQPVIGIQDKSASGTATLYVSHSNKPLPVELDERNDQGGTATLQLSQWGERISVKAPSGAIPIASL